MSAKTRRDMDIIEMATANVRSNMNATVNMETPWGKSLKMLPQFTLKDLGSIDSYVVKLLNQLS